MVLCSLTLPFWKNPLKKSHFIIFMFAKINIDGILSRVAKHYSLTMSLPQTELLHRQSSSHLCSLLEEVIKKTDQQLTQATGNASLPTVCPWMWFLLAFPTPTSCLRMQAWDRNFVLRLSGHNTWLNPVKDLYINFNDLAVRCKDLLVFQPPKTKLLSKFPCLLKHHNLD